MRPLDLTSGEIFSGIILAAAVLGALTMLWKAARRTRRTAGEVTDKARRVSDSILGRPAVIDTITGKELAPALPGIGQRMDTVERAVIALADQHLKLDDHEGRIKALEEAAVERVVTRAESAQAWQTMEAAIKATPEEDTDATDD